MATVNEDINPQRLDDDMCRRALNRAHKKVVAEMDPDVVLNGLRNSGFLPQGEYEDLMNLITLPMKCRLLVNKISQGGNGAYFEFKKCLRATNHEQLVIELELKEVEIISEMTRYTELQNERSSRRNNEFTLYERMETDDQTIPPAPALQRSALYGIRRDQEFVQTITKDLHNGRLIELTKEMVEELKSPGVSEQGHRGGFGTVYISKDQVPGFNLRVVLKEINAKQKDGNLSQKLGSVTNEKIAARLMHFAIVPLLAYHDDHHNEKYYFISPYLENGDLFEAIAHDRLYSSAVKLNWEIRIKIMYQIACGIDFMHTGNKFRGTILHMDIKSKNVVLDAKFNARLIDFGLARELKEGDEKLLLTALPVGTPGYFPTVRHNLLTKQHDFHNFGVVLRELLTGLEPSEKEEGVDFRNWHKSLILRKKKTGKLCTTS
ncbi:uncharacterized protein LOC127834928 [Dreissena polymorpha]|uniref:uncharacterized protein LOC127834928 n=1 Tax=Dreissena polymorpha TaxID=45954 RepID=UPI0022647CBF|nr:uncharacterized protein LOC127834928 [Dreissena polymorpha]